MEAPWWTPNQMPKGHTTQVEKLRVYLNKRWNINLKTFWDMHTFSVKETNKYWSSIWDWANVVGEKGGEDVFQKGIPMDQQQLFFPTSKLNLAENMLMGHPSAKSDRLAIISTCEPDAKGDTHLRSLTYIQLYEEVSRTVQALQKAGVKQGDVVASYSAHNAESAIAFLATIAIGAQWSSIAAEAGPLAVLDRMVQLKPKVLFSVDQCRYSGKILPHLSKLDEVVVELKKHGLKHVIVVGHLAKDREPIKNKYTSWNAFLDKTDAKKDIPFVRASFRAPAVILFSSGTTGKPKAIIHSAGGVLMAQKCAGLLHADCDHNDVLLQFTTMSWVMWIAALNAIMCGGTMVAYDGSPLVKPGILFDLVEKHKITFLGISPRYLQTLEAASYYPNEKHDTSSLRVMLSTGSTLRPESYDFISEHIGRNIYLQNTSGGTDVCGSFLGCVPNLPQYRGELACPILGLDVQAWSEDGKRVFDKPGNLVCVNPFPYMPLGFVGDENRKKIRETYYSTFSTSVWDQADFIIQSSKTGGTRMLGRADGTLNPRGVRFGSSELYAVLENMQEDIDDCMAIGQRTKDDDERVILFIKPRTKFNENLKDKIRKAIKTRLSSRHVPEIILACPDIPYTATGKRMEIPVKRLVNGNMGLEGVNRGAMANPESIDWFYKNQALSLDKAKL